MWNFFEIIFFKKGLDTLLKKPCHIVMSVFSKNMFQFDNLIMKKFHTGTKRIAAEN